MFSLEDLKELEKLIASVGQNLLMPYFSRVNINKKSDGTIVTEADLDVQKVLSRELVKRWDSFNILGEEMDSLKQQSILDSNYDGLWVLDPLDGTNNFANGIPFFCISIALISKNEILAGVIHDPIRNETFSALKERGAWHNKKSLVVKGKNKEILLKDAIAIVDLKRLPNQLRSSLFDLSPFRSHRSFGAVALDWCWLASERAHVYLHGGQKLWDYAAGSLIFREAGGSGGLFLDYYGKNNDYYDLLPRVAIAALSEDLLQEWNYFLSQANKKS
tara:strand:+ start:330 stop:1154 length:825 start_codon:yes stop_codon:yes gene_type:complete